MGFFNVNEYEMVQDRITRFQKLFPNGSIVNTVELFTDDFSKIMVKCEVYRDVKDQKPAAVDIAMDWKNKDRGATTTNWVETASTSATGRALSLVIGFKGKGRASAEEMIIANARRQNKDVEDFYKEVEEPKEKVEKVKPKPVKKEAKKVKEVKLPEVPKTPEKPKKPGGMSGEDARKQEVWENVKELKQEYEKSMTEANPGIPTYDSRMKFPSSVYNNMEKCLDTLGAKKYEVKWEQWLDIHNGFKPKKLEPQEPKEDDGIPVEEALAELGVDGVLSPDDLPPEDQGTKFDSFPELDHNIAFKYRVKPISDKQVGFILKLGDRHNASERLMTEWVLVNFKKTLRALDSKEANIIIAAYTAGQAKTSKKSSTWHDSL